MTVKHAVRAEAGYRCVRCGHPYEKGMGEWSPCDAQCSHGEPTRWVDGAWPEGGLPHGETPKPVREAAWRTLTVHHLNGQKNDLRWWNLASLCQRCHLRIQRTVVMPRVFPYEHSEWFKPYAAGWYASIYLGEELTRAETMARLDELLALELMVTPT